MLILAHRGYHAEAMENTMAAFSAAVALGCDGIETDIRLTRDGEPILYHSPLRPDGAPVGSLTHEQLEGGLGHGVPTLQEALTRWPRILWNTEIKDASDPARIADILRPFQESHRLLVTSFDHALVAILARELAAECGLLIADRASRFESLANQWATYPTVRTVVLHHRLLDAHGLETVHAAGFRCFVYGTATPAEHAECARLGVDGVITDHPGAALPAG
jgi:glycerophosphoryl diester phosphodiesterase